MSSCIASTEFSSTRFDTETSSFLAAFNSSLISPAIDLRSDSSWLWDSCHLDMPSAFALICFINSLQQSSSAVIVRFWDSRHSRLVDARTSDKELFIAIIFCSTSDLRPSNWDEIAATARDEAIDKSEHFSIRVNRVLSLSLRVISSREIESSMWVSRVSGYMDSSASGRLARSADVVNARVRRG